jgi:hypothetical protein
LGKGKNKNKLEEKAMRRILFLLGIVLTAVLTASAQVSPDYIFGNNMGNGWSWTTGTQGTPSLGGSFKWQFQANATGNQYFKFGETSSNADDSGFWYVGSGGDVQYPGGGNWGDKWTAYYHANMGDAGAFYFSVTSGNYYVIKARKQSGNDADFAVFWNDAAPVTITSVTRTISGTILYVDVTLSGTKSAQEKVWVRYSTNNWASSNTVEADNNVSGNTWRATINLNSGDFVSYYAFTTLNLTSAPAESDADFYTINYNNNNGVNYTVQIGPLSGDYYIPQGSNAKGYSSLASAIQNLNENGASGTVRFLIDGDLNEIGANLRIYRPDLNATNNLIIKPAPGKTPTITITGCNTSGSTAYAGLTIDNTDYVTIDGSNTDGGTTRDLTIIMNDGTSGRHAIQIYGDADYIIVKNLKIRYNAIGSTTSGNAIFVNGQSNGVSDNVSIINCEIGENSETLVGPIYGISFTGASSAGLYCTNGIIANNVIYARMRGINLFWHNGPGDVMNIYGNEIGVVNSIDGYVTWGVLHQNYAGTLNFYNNVIRTIVQKTSGTQGIYGFGTLNGVAGAVVNIFNNFLGGDFNHIGTGTPASIDVISFQDAPAATCNVYYNTVILNNMTKTASGRMTCIRLAGTWTKNVKNNIFINKKTGTSIAYCILMGATTGTSNFDYNLYYLDDNTNGNVGYWTSAQKTLANWQSASGQDFNSVSKNVTFVSSTDLHLASPSKSDLDLAGTPISGITTDIDGDTRHSTYPFKGADEGVLPSTLPTVTALKVFDNGGTSTTPGTSNYPVLKVKFTVDNQWARISGLTVKKFVNVSGRTLAGDGEVTLKAWIDANGNDQVDASDTYLGSGTFSSSSATVNFPAQTVTTTGLDILLTIDVSATADPSHWVALKIESPSDVNVTSPADKSTANYPIQNVQDISLPVQVASVLADVSGRDVKIKIKTQTERDDFLGFNVYRSGDGESFVMVGSYESVSSLRAKGNMAYGGEYEFVDKGLNSGRYQYKIEAVSRSEKKFVGDVISVEVGVPKGYALHQNYPNPFNPVTVIEFETPEAGYVLIELYNSAGQKVRDIFAGELPAGYHKVRFDASGLSSGVYFYRMSAGKFNAVRKMVIMK